MASRQKKATKTDLSFNPTCCVKWTDLFHSELMTPRGHVIHVCTNGLNKIAYSKGVKFTVNCLDRYEL